MPPCMTGGGHRFLGAAEVDKRCNNGRDDNPEELEPVKERDADKLWIFKVVEGGPEHRDEGEEQEQQEPGAALFPSA